MEEEVQVEQVKEKPKFNMAQLVLLSLGVPRVTLELGHKQGKYPSNTKRGSGRFHVQGQIVG